MTNVTFVSLIMVGTSNTAANKKACHFGKHRLNVSAAMTHTTETRKIERGPEYMSVPLVRSPLVLTNP